jgi:multidrug efflux pump
MTGIVDWAAGRARMVLAFVLMSVAAGTIAYVGLPKEGEPDIDIPGLFVSIPFPGISAEDSETLIVKPVEQEMEELDGLKEITSTAAEGFAGVFMEFEFGWDKTATIADVRDAMGRAEASFPVGADQYQIQEINFSEFPIMIVSLSGRAPERTLLRLATELQDRLEGMPALLEAGLAGHRDEMLEVLIDPLALEAYNVTAGELLATVEANNLLIPAGTTETATGAFAVKLAGAFDTAADVYDLPVKVSGDRVVTLGDLAQLNLTFEDRLGTARYNGETTVAIQVVKRLGFNIIDTAAEVRAEVDAAVAEWPDELREAVNVDITLDQSRTVRSMVSQLEGSVMTAIALVMIVVLATLGTRSALLVGFAIPTSFLLCFVLLGVAGIAISNIVMFGLILAVGMLVDGAIVVTEYADKRIKAGTGPMTAYTEAAKRMFWPVVSSTATTLCAFLPMLFWPGVAGQFMGMLPVTLIAVLSASLLVALIYLPVLGGVTGRMGRGFARGGAWLRAHLPWPLRAALVLLAGWGMFTGALQTINPSYLLAEAAPAGTMGAVRHYGAGPLLFVLSCFAMSTALASVAREPRPRRVEAGYRRTLFGRFVHLLVGNPIMPLVAIGTVGAFVVATFATFAQNNNGVEFFVESELENAIVYVRARGNLSLEEQDALLRQAEEIVLATPGIDSAFAFAGDGGLNTAGPAGGSAPADAIGQVQVEMVPWEERPTVPAPWFSVLGYEVTTQVVDPAFDGDRVAEAMMERLRELPGIKVELSAQDRGPASGKPVHLRLRGNDWEALQRTAREATALFEGTPGLVDVDNTLPLPGIDWEIDVDVEKAGRFGADVATVGAMVQLVTRGVLLDTYTPEGNDEEIEIRLRLPEEDRVLSTLDSLKVRTPDGLVPLANFIERRPVPRLAQIDRIDGERYFDVRAGVGPDLVNLVDAAGASQGIVPAAALEAPGEAERLAREGLSPVPVTPSERIAALTPLLAETMPEGITFEWTGDQEDQAESQAFLTTAFAAALGLMFVILLAQFNSVYNAVLVLLAVILSTTGVLIGMLVMDQTFSIIMTGTGIVALAGIVVNNNIVLIDTYQEYSRYMPRIEAITRTAEDRIRPVLLTTLTTMAGLAPMMFGLSLDFFSGGYSLRSPTALWWIQLATAVVFGLGVATVLTLLFTPSMLALRVWFWVIAGAASRGLGRIGASRMSRRGQDWALRSAARRVRAPLLLWAEEEAVAAPAPIRAAPEAEPVDPPAPPLRAAE